MRDAFVYLDVNKNKQITINEFYYGLMRLRLPFNEKQVKCLFDFIDAQKRGCIKYVEF